MFVDTRPADEAAGPSADAGDAAPQRDEGQATEQSAGVVVSWASKLAPGHEHALLGGIAGLLVAVLLVVNFWFTLFAVALTVVGVAVGQAVDGDPKIINSLRRVFEEGRGGDR